MAKSFKGFADKFRGFFAEFPKDKTRICASSFAYYCFLSVVPLIALCVSMVSYIDVSQDEVVTFISAMVPDSLDEMMETLVGEAYLYSDVLISINTIILIWASS